MVWFAPLSSVFAAAFAATALAASALAAPAPQHSKVIASTSAAGDSLEFKFVVEANKNMMITFDAPWTLDLLNAKDLEFSSSRYGKAELDEKLPGFVVKTVKTPATSKGEVEYKLVSFICTKDKTQCYREVHSGKVPWTVAQTTAPGKK